MEVATKFSQESQERSETQPNVRPDKTTKGEVGVFFVCPECGEHGTIMDARAINMMMFGSCIALTCKHCGKTIGIDNKELIAVPVPTIHRGVPGRQSGATGPVIVQG